MSSGKLPVLSYNAQHHVVRLELPRSVALDTTKPPSDLIARAKTKLDKVLGEGKIGFYDIYQDKLEAVWTALREYKNKNDDFTVNIVLAAGAPKIEGLTILKSSGPKIGMSLSTSGPIDIKKIPLEWIRAHVLKFARDEYPNENIFLPHLQSALLRIVAGDTLSSFQIEFRQGLPAQEDPGKQYAVFANKARGEVFAYIYDLPGMQSEPAIDRLCDLVHKAVEKLQSTGIQDLVVLKSELSSQIRSAMSGAERVGVGMPLGVLVAMPDLSKILGKKFLNFLVSDDQMSATISDFDFAVYDDPDFKISKEFLINQLRKSELIGDLSDQDLVLLVEAASRRDSLNGKIAARGKIPESGADPYIHLVYRDAPKPVNEADVINIRDSQQRSIVQAGQMVAEIRYQKPETIGMNVLGKKLQPEPGPTLDVTLGEGIQQLQPGKFYAEYSGVPECEGGNKLTLTKSHVHEGDVNLKSGNIYFDGPVEIKGSVDSGAMVRVKGPIKIHGSITGGTVISRDPIEVVESIVTGTNAKVICSTQIKASFIENSNIECDGSIVVAKSLVSSEVVAGDYIQALAPDGIIGGGTIMCRNMVAAANIGFAKGARTKFIVGVDHRIVRRTKILEKRLQNLLSAQERYKLEFRELAQKKESQLTPKHKQLKEALKEKMNHVRPLIESVTLRLETLKTSMAYNEEALIAATNVFAANCQIEVGGQGVVLEADTMAVGISARKRRDSHLCTFDEIKSEIESRLSGVTNSSVSPAAVSTAEAETTPPPAEEQQASPTEVSAAGSSADDQETQASDQTEQSSLQEVAPKAS